MNNLAPYPKFKAFADDGTPLNGGKLYTYVTGTATPKATYSNSALSAENTNPVILDSEGEADVFLSGSYKFVLDDSADVQIMTADGVTSSTLYSGGEITNYVETTNTTLTASLDFEAGNVHVRTLTGVITFTIDNAPLSGSSKLELLVINGSTYTVTWPTVTWIGGAAPTLTAKDIIVFSKYEGDSTIYALYCGSAV